MTSRLLFHIGDHKTGSTAIQNCLATGAWTSGRGSLLYPAQVNHFGLSSALRTVKEVSKEERHARFARIAARINANDAEVAVISSEQFEDVDPAALWAEIETHFPQYASSVEVIAYVRPHAERVLSSFNQMTKLGRTRMTLAEFHADQLAKGNYLYTPRFDRWRALFGDRLILRPMVRSALYQNCVVHDFLKHALRTEEVSLTAPALANSAASMEDLSMFRLMHKLWREAGIDTRTNLETAAAFDRILDEHQLKAPVKPALHRALTDQIIADYRADAASMDAQYFTGQPLTEALKKARGKSIPEEQPVQAHDYHGGQARQMIRGYARLTADLLAEQGPEMAKRLRHLRALRLQHDLSEGDAE